MNLKEDEEQYASVVILAGGLCAKARKKCQKLGDASRGSLYREQSADFSSGGSGRGARNGRQEPDCGNLEARLGHGLILLALGGKEGYLCGPGMWPGVCLINIVLWLVVEDGSKAASLETKNPVWRPSGPEGGLDLGEAEAGMPGVLQREKDGSQAQVGGSVPGSRPGTGSGWVE